MLKTVQFNREARGGAVEVEKGFPRRMLAAELESGKPPRPQRAPKLLFFLRLLTTETPGVYRGVHGRESRAGNGQDKWREGEDSQSEAFSPSSRSGRRRRGIFVLIPLSPALSPLVPRGEREKIRSCRFACFHRRRHGA